VAQADHWLPWSKGRRPPGAVLHSSCKPSEISRWLCYDDSTNIVLVIIIIISTPIVIEVNGRDNAFVQCVSVTVQLTGRPDRSKTLLKCLKLQTPNLNQGFLMFFLTAMILSAELRMTERKESHSASTSSGSVPRHSNLFSTALNHMSTKPGINVGTRRFTDASTPTTSPSLFRLH